MNATVSSSLELINRYLERIRSQETSPIPLLLGYDAVVQDLRTWLW